MIVCTDFDQLCINLVWGGWGQKSVGWFHIGNQNIQLLLVLAGSLTLHYFPWWYVGFHLFFLTYSSEEYVALRYSKLCWTRMISRIKVHVWQCGDEYIHADIIVWYMWCYFAESIAALLHFQCRSKIENDKEGRRLSSSRFQMIFR